MPAFIAVLTLFLSTSTLLPWAAGIVRSDYKKYSILYQLPDDKGKVQVVIKDETIWATQKAMAQLFDVGVPAISKHLKNIFEEEELPESSVVSKMEITASDGKDYLTSFYSLDAIIAVGYRVSSARATKFRQWATKVV